MTDNPLTKCTMHTQTHCSHMDPDAVSNRIQELENTLAAIRYLPTEPLHYLLVCSGSTSLTFRLLQPPLGPEDLHLGHSIVLLDALQDRPQRRIRVI